MTEEDLNVKEINELILPNDLFYTEAHEWAKTEKNSVKIGITDYAQDQLGDIVFVELPQVGDTFEKGSVFGSLESVKAVSEIYMPVSGKVTAINTALADSPELVNQDPYAAWIIEISPTDLSETDTLMKKDAYLKQLKG